MIKMTEIGEILNEIRTITEFVIVGDTIVDVTLKRKGTESDVDIFPTTISAFADEDVIRNFAYSNGWDFGRTPIDTPRIVVELDEGQLQLDFYDNIQDFYVPSKLLDSSIEVKIGNYTFKSIPLEGYVVLKAYAYREEDEDELRSLSMILSEKNIRIEVDKITSFSELFEDSTQSIVKRLKNLGIIR
ncbi:nucleotidyltransferase [Sulfolobales archaeon HS-7]|nr:nucleotidyltransferase [Sulfolobales archaeon HS-7]